MFECEMLPPGSCTGRLLPPAHGAVLAGGRNLGEWSLTWRREVTEAVILKTIWQVPGSFPFLCVLATKM